MGKLNFFPSLISADILNLKTVIKELEPYCAGFHIDIMDFHFVPNLAFSPEFSNDMRTISKKKLWVHLMVDNPEKYIDLLKLNAHDIVSVHYERLSSPKILQKLKSLKLVASLAIKPSTPLAELLPFLEEVDHILLMSVEPGFSGQPFKPEALERLKHLNKLRTEKKLNFKIGIDGGVTEENIAELLLYGANDIALASTLFESPDPVKVLQELQKF